MSLYYARLNSSWSEFRGPLLSFISYRVAQTQDVSRVALEAGNSLGMIFKHYRELVREADGKKWFSIMPKKK